jgi:hypothetical protein
MDKKRSVREWFKRREIVHQRFKKDGLVDKEKAEKSESTNSSSIFPFEYALVIISAQRERIDRLRYCSFDDKGIKLQNYY